MGEYRKQGSRELHHDPGIHGTLKGENSQKEKDQERQKEHRTNL
jgi:hypothetical protein